MKRGKPIKSLRNGRSPRKDEKHLRRGRRFTKEQCNHCGGIFRYELDGRAVCVMCGREKKHLCADCLNVAPVRHSPKPGVTKEKNDRR